MMMEMSRLKMRTQSLNFTSPNNSKVHQEANVNASGKDCKQFGFSQSKCQDRFKRESKEVRQNSNTLAGPKCYGCQGYGHMKQECPTYLKSTGKSKALSTTLILQIKLSKLHFQILCMCCTK